jgi:hypothetical protein
MYCFKLDYHDIGQSTEPDSESVYSRCIDDSNISFNEICLKIAQPEARPAPPAVLGTAHPHPSLHHWQPGPALKLRTLPPPILKYASISKYRDFEVLRYRSYFDIEVQHFRVDIVVQHFDIEATKKPSRYRSFFDIEAACFDIGCQKSKSFDIEVYVLRYRYLNTLISKHLD